MTEFCKCGVIHRRLDTRENLVAISEDSRHTLTERLLCEINLFLIKILTELRKEDVQ